MAARPIAADGQQRHDEQECPGHQPRVQQRRHQRIEDLVEPRLLDGVEVVRVVIGVARPRLPALYLRRSTWYAIQGVIVKATTIDMSIVTGTFSAIGRMYGPIMPVMKNIGRKLTITASVAVISGGRISATASSTIRRVAFLRRAKCRAMFSTSTIGSSTNRPSDRIKREQRDAVDREAQHQVDRQRQPEDDRHGHRHDQRLAPAQSEGQQGHDDQDRPPPGLRPVR